jgi:hypothetical protein
MMLHFKFPFWAFVCLLLLPACRGNLFEPSFTAALGSNVSTKILAIGNSFSFFGVGGKSPYVYSIISGSGSLNSSTGLFVAPGSPGSTTIQVLDAVGAKATIAVTTNPALSISSPVYRITTPAIFNPTFLGLNGAPPYTYSIQSGPGFVNSSTGVYTPSNTTTGATVLVVSDSAGNSATSAIDNIRYRIDGRVFAAVHSGFSFYVGGAFSAVNPIDAPYMAALDSTGYPTGCNFGSGFNGTVLSFAKSGSSIYVGGQFTSYRGQSANYIAKLDATTCALDTTFSPPGSNGFSGEVDALAISGTSLYVGGDFAAYRGVANSARNLAKLNLTSGAVDTTFSPVGAASNGFDSSVSALAVSGSSIYVGGNFSIYKGVANSANFLAKLDLTSGAIDTIFSPVGALANGFDTSVSALAVSGNSLYVGGGFGVYRGTDPSTRIAKLDLSSGAIDTTFSPPAAEGFDDDVYSLLVFGSSLYAGGQFNVYRGVADSAHHLAKLDLTSGAIDTTFSPVGATANGFSQAIYAMGASETSLYVGGDIGDYRGVANASRHLAKLDFTSGAIDTTFKPGATSETGTNNIILALMASGGVLYVGGAFTAYSGQSANNLAKIDDTTLELDTTFSPPNSNGFDPGQSVLALGISGSSLYVAGQMNAYRGVADSAINLAKLDLTSGAIDTTFSPVGANSNGFSGSGYSRALAISGSSLYIGGSFTAYRGVANSANSLAKLDLTSGAIDTTFSPVGAAANGFSGGTKIVALAIAGTSLYVGGAFTAYRGVADSAHYLAKLNLTSGAIDTIFSPVGATTNGFDSNSESFAINETAPGVGSLYVGGDFDVYRGVANSAHRLAKLDLTNGAIDTTFSPVGATANGFAQADDIVFGMTLSGSSLYVGGAFTAYRGIANSANRLAKLDLTTGAIDTTFSPVGATANGFDDVVISFSVFGSSLFICGSFKTYRGSSALFFVPIDLTTGVLGD